MATTRPVDSRSTEQKLADAGYSMQEARDYVLGHVNNGKLIADKGGSIGLTSVDLGHIAGVSTDQVVNFMAQSGVDVNTLNQQKTNLSLVSDLSTGNVYLYDPIGAIGRKVISFGTQITDIASAYNGDVYATSFNAIYRYSFETQKVELVSSASYGTNSLTMYGTSMITASNNDNVVRFLNSNGKEFAAYSLPGGAAGGDVLVRDNQLYRTTGEGIMRTDMLTGQTVKETGAVGAKYHGLSEATWGWIVGFANDDSVTAYNPTTRDVMNLPQLTLAGVTPSGATEALQMQVDAWA